jgi:thioredoxin 1
VVKPYQEEFMEEMLHIGEADFQTEVLDSSLPVLVDFTAVWCGPCKMLEPVVKQLSDDWSGKVKIAKLDVDENPSLAMRYQVMGVPTLLLFINGEPKERITGYHPKDRIEQKISAHLE